jgi:hypothetical protein
MFFSTFSSFQRWAVQLCLFVDHGFLTVQLFDVGYSTFRCSIVSPSNVQLFDFQSFSHSTFRCWSLSKFWRLVVRHSIVRCSEGKSFYLCRMFSARLKLSNHLKGLSHEIEGGFRWYWCLDLCVERCRKSLLFSEVLCQFIIQMVFAEGATVAEGV